MSKKKGDSFRDDVASLLKATGFTQVETETLIEFKHVDISTVWNRNTLDGPIRYAIETKTYTNAVPLDECSLFCSQYGQLVRSGIVDRAWLISQGEISSAGRNQIRSTYGHNLDCMTFNELQSKILPLEGYLQSLTKEYNDSGLRNYFLPPRLQDNSDLLHAVVDWINKPEATPLAILGAYGQGKSTFACHLANYLIERRKSDVTSRIPILIPLGDILDEQSIEGLLGKLFTSRYRVENYHFELFSALNEQGRFVLIFDGFDEMKHGMTFHAFKNNMNEIMKLDRGNSRIIILGRHTIFQDSREFRAIISGRDFTLAGQDIASAVRRPCLQLELCEFSREDSIAFVNTYFRYKLSTTKQFSSQVSDHWIRWRIEQLCHPKYESIIRRPVHAQMMCDVAIDPEYQFSGMTMYELYDAFIHQLLAREVRKRGRYAEFGVDLRRRFNRAIAWWLWNQGAVTTTSLADLPNEICASVVSGIAHQFDQEGLKRELISGCLVEKARGGVYFGHRSIQEFLVADYMWEDAFALNGNTKTIDLDKNGITLAALTQSSTVDVMQFVEDRINLDMRLGKDVPNKVSLILKNAIPSSDNRSGRGLLYPFFRISKAVGIDDHKVYLQSPFGFAIAFFGANGEISYEVKNIRSLEFLRRLVREGMAEPFHHVSSIVHLWMQIALHNSDLFSEELIAEFLVRLLPLKQMSTEITLMSQDPVRESRVLESVSYRQWLFMQFTRRRTINKMERFIIFWPALIAYLQQNVALIENLDAPFDHGRFDVVLECTPEKIFEQIDRCNSERLLDDFETENAKLFFDKASIRSQFVAVRG
jgi:NACHT domain